MLDPSAVSPQTLHGARILIVIGGHLATAPRPLKEAAALSAAGARVTVRGTWWSDVFADEDEELARRHNLDFAPVVDIRAGRRGGVVLRARQRFARECFRRFGLVTARSFGVGAPELLAEARRLDPDLTLVHSEAGLLVAKQLLKDGRRVGVDFEDWFSQDLRPSDRVERPVRALQRLERDLLRNAQVCFTTTTVMAEALARDAGVERRPLFVPNCFPAHERTTAKPEQRETDSGSGISFHWLSQTIGPGRGLETLARALPLLRGQWSVALRGALRNHDAWFEQTFAGSRPRVRVLEPVPNGELLSRTMAHDVGLALEEPYCANKDLTASNKLFEYMRAGLAVIATDTKGQREVMNKSPEAGLLVAPASVDHLASAMQLLLDDPGRRNACRRAAVEAAEGIWAWERWAPAVVNATALALESSRTGRAMS